VSIHALSPTRIPYLDGALRSNAYEGCDITPEVCAVRGIEACWARNMAIDECRRIGTCPAKCPCEGIFAPSFHPDRLDAILRVKKPTVFVHGFGGDLFCEGFTPKQRAPLWDVIRKVEGRGHAHVLLTKNPGAIDVNEMVGLHSDSLERMWFGVSITGADDLWRIAELDRVPMVSNRWVSAEPCLKGFGCEHCLPGYFDGIEFVVIGGLTDGKGRMIPPDEPHGTRPEWVQPITNAVHEAEVPAVFLKGLSNATMQQITDPRTGRPFHSCRDEGWREVPGQWRLR